MPVTQSATLEQRITGLSVRLWPADLAAAEVSVATLIEGVVVKSGVVPVGAADLAAMMGEIPQPGESLYDVMKRVLYQHLLATGNVTGALA